MRNLYREKLFDSINNRLIAHAVAVFRTQISKVIESCLREPNNSRVQFDVDHHEIIRLERLLKNGPHLVGLRDTGAFGPKELG